MAVPTINFNIEQDETEVLHSVSDVLYVVGEAGTDGTGEVGTIYNGESLADFLTPVGSDGDLYDFLDSIFSRIRVETYVSLYTSTEDADNDPSTDETAKSDSDLEESRQAAINLITEVRENPTVLHIVGDAAAIGDATSASTIAARLAVLAEQLGCRAVCNSAQDTKANAEAWGTNNTGPYLLGVFNQHGPSSDYKYPAGPWLAATLLTAREQGRAWGINYAEVRGIAGLRHSMNVHDSALNDLDAAGVSTIIFDEGLYKIIGDEFKTAGRSDPTRFWSIARVVDYVERTLTAQARGFVSSTYSAGRQAIKMTRTLDSLDDIISGSVVPDLSQTQGLEKHFIADLELLYATTTINIKLRFSNSA